MLQSNRYISQTIFYCIQIDVLRGVKFFSDLNTLPFANTHSGPVQMGSAQCLESAWVLHQDSDEYARQVDNIYRIPLHDVLKKHNIPPLPV